MTMPGAAPRTLVLWDIDHTLIETRGVGRAIYDRAFPAATGKPLAKLATIAGRTELDIMAESLKVNGLEATDRAVQKLADALVQGYEDARDELAAVGRALPGARQTLQQFAADHSVHQAILTGNLRQVARIKLEAFDLAGFLDFDSSAFGEDHAERSELVKIARQRAATQTGTWYQDQHVVLVGDTPNDMKAGRSAGVRVVGVATGKTSEAELRRAGATQTVPTLLELSAVVFPAA
ncbi:HAD family hydrolase [Amycolatopsis sp. cg9]|uniref:HAD family hydrolase n=1 Tax=Amycolatopsis sp. cg9 TaxID=3238801 RepID=UPI003525D70C